MRKTAAILVLTATMTTLPALAQPAADGPEFQVNTFTIFSQFDPDAVILPNGDIVIVYTDLVRDNSLSGIFARRFDSTGNPLDPNGFLVNVHTPSAQFGPVVASNTAGEFVIVWSSLSQDGDDGGVFGRAFDSLGMPLTGDFQVNQHTTGFQGYPSVAMHPNGDFVVAWTSVGQDGDSAGIFARRMEGMGLPRGPALQLNLTTADQQKSPAVAMDGKGDFVAIWNSYYQDGSGAGIFGRKFASSGSPLTGEFQVNEWTTSLQKFPSVAMHANGEFVVVWSSHGADGSGYAAAARRFHGTAAPAGPEFAANAYTTNWQRNPDVAMDAAGNFVVAWQDAARDGDSSGVFAALLDAGGISAGGDFQVNTYTTSYQDYPTVALGPGGDFVVAWTSAGQDGSQGGVFAQRYVAPDPCGLLDADADGLGDLCDVALLSPVADESLDCTNPKSGRPRIAWNGGSYDRFRIEIAWDPSFAKGFLVTSGSELKKGNFWLPATKKWRKVCQNAGTDLYVRVFGVDLDVDKLDPARENFSQTIQAVAVN